ncbi:MAG: two-component regulator propeller domain-containing protein, partial [Anaerolineales bacterium]
MRENLRTILFAMSLAALSFSACSNTIPSTPTLPHSPPQYERSQNWQETAFLPPRNARFDRLTSTDGLSFPTVLDILQDKLGFLWFATTSGLNKYDGYSFTVFKNQPGNAASLDFDDLDAIFEDSNGNIWVGGAGGIDQFDRGSETFSRIDERGQVYCITEDKDGTIWAGFWHGLYGYDRDTHEIIHSFPSSSANPSDSNGLINGSVRSLLEDSHGYLWVGTTAGLHRLDRATGSFVYYGSDPGSPNSLSDDEILVIFEDRQGILWVGTGRGGLNRLDRTTETFQRYRHDPEDPESISSNVVLSLAEDSRGSLWVGTSMGLDLYDPERTQFIHYTHDAQNTESLSDNVIFSLLEDRSGVLWIGTANGVSKMVPRKNQFIDLADMQISPMGELDRSAYGNSLADLGQNKVFSMLEDNERTLWFGTRLGGLYRLNPTSGEVMVYRHDPDDAASIISDQIYAIYQDSSERLWVGTGNGWLEQWIPQTEGFSHEYSLGAPIRAISEDPSGNLWIGTQGEGLYQLDSTSGLLIQHPFIDSVQWQGHNSLSSHIVETLVVDQSGALWIGTYVGGLNRWHESRFTHFHYDPNDSSSLSHDHVLSLLEDLRSNTSVFWIGTMGGGLNRFDQQTQSFTRYSIAEGLADSIVNCILMDD